MDGELQHHVYLHKNCDAVALESNSKERAYMVRRHQEEAQGQYSRFGGALFKNWSSASQDVWARPCN